MPSVVVYLNEDEYDSLRKLARKEKKSTAMFLAEVARTYIAKPPEP